MRSASDDGGERDEAAAGARGRPRCASRVLPTPPGPTSVSRRVVCERRRGRARTSLARGRRCGVGGAGGTAGAAPGRGASDGLVGEDRLLERAAAPGPGSSPSCVERRAGVLEGGERVGVAAGAVEGEHLLAAQAFAQADARRRTSRGRRRGSRARRSPSVGLDAVLDRRSPAALRAVGPRPAGPARSAGRPARAPASATGRGGPRLVSRRSAGTRRPRSAAGRLPGRAPGAAGRPRPAATCSRWAAPLRPRVPGSACPRPPPRSRARAGRPAARADVARRGRRERRRCGPPAVPGCRTRAPPGEPTGGPCGSHGPPYFDLRQAAVRRAGREVRANANPVQRRGRPA